MKSNLKTFAALLPMLLLVCTFAYAHLPSERDDPYTTKTFTLKGQGKLNVETSGGSIQVAGTDGNQVTVEMYVKKSGSWTDWFSSDDDIEESLEEYNIDISQQGNTVNAVAKRKGKKWGNNKLSISFKVMVPKKMETQLNTSGGSITLSDVEGRQEVSTSGGSLNFENIAGNTTASTSGGSINVDGYEGTLDAKTSGGSIRLFRGTGEMNVHTSGGSIVMDDISGSVEATTSGGSIKAAIENLGEYLTLHTSGGSINAVVPQGLGLDLDLSGNRVNTQLTNFTGETKKDHIEGSINGGGIPVKMSTSGGSVNLDYRAQASN